MWNPGQSIAVQTQIANAVQVANQTQATKSSLRNGHSSTLGKSVVRYGQSFSRPMRNIPRLLLTHGTWMRATSLPFSLHLAQKMEMQSETWLSPYISGNKLTITTSHRLYDSLKKLNDCTFSITYGQDFESSHDKDFMLLANKFFSSTNAPLLHDYLENAVKKIDLFVEYDLPSIYFRLHLRE